MIISVAIMTDSVRNLGRLHLVPCSVPCASILLIHPGSGYADSQLGHELRRIISSKIRIRSIAEEKKCTV